MSIYPLEGVKILDFSRVLAGPYATMILGELGAEVIKVEPPKGDETRSWAPFIDGESVYYMSINRNKKSIAIDLKSDEGREIIYKLVRDSDIVIENFRPGVAEKLGIDYNTLKRINSSIIYCSIKGFWSRSRYASRPSYDIIIQGMSGLMSTTGEEGRPPIRVSFALADIFTAYNAVANILAMYINRLKTGEGGYIEVDLLDTLIYAMSYVPMIYLATGRIPKRYGSGHPSIVPYQAFECRDGKYLIVAVGNERHWEGLCRALGREDFINDERFKTNPDRVRNRDILIPILENIFRERDREEWIKILNRFNVPNGPVYSLDEVFKDPYIDESKIVDIYRHSKLGEVRYIAYPAYINNMRPKPKTPPPDLGRDAYEILTKLGYNREDINRLAEKGIVCCI